MHLLRRQLLASAVAMSLSGRANRALAQAAQAAASLAPSGRLRAAINLGNTVLAQRNAAGDLGGVSVVLARALAERLKIPLDLIAFDAAGQVFAALDRGDWDLAFLAVEPERAARIDFSPPYVVIEATALVRGDSPILSVAQLDRPGVRIAVAKGAAYDLYLTRTLRNAELRRAPTGPAAIDMFLAGGLDAVAGIRPFLDERAGGAPGLRVLQDSFSRVEQAIGLPRGRRAGAAYVRTFLEDMKATGAVRRALDATGQASAVVAPPARAPFGEMDTGSATK